MKGEEWLMIDAKGMQRKSKKERFPLYIGNQPLRAEVSG